MRFSLSNFKPGLWWLQWVAILIAVGLFAGISLLITVLVPAAEHMGQKPPFARRNITARGRGMD